MYKKLAFTKKGIKIQKSLVAYNQLGWNTEPNFAISTLLFDLINTHKSKDDFARYQILNN